ncbi:MAG: adenine phosphoribosyltransferase [Pleomorphochaeta sp.]
MEKYDLDSAIRKVKDFPKEGILFYDITGILAKPEAFNYCIDAFYDLYKDKKIDGIVCLEARGFIFASPLAAKMNVPLILARKKGKLPGAVYEKEFALEYGVDTICIQHVDINEGDKILIIDDLLATGGTIDAARAIIEENGAEVEAIGGVIGLPFLGYEKVLEKYKIDVLLTYEGE